MIRIVNQELRIKDIRNCVYCALMQSIKLCLFFIILITNLFIFIALFSTSSVYALNPTPSVSAAPTASPSANLQTKLKALQEEIASKAAKLKQEVGKNLQNKAYIGLFDPDSNTSFKVSTVSSAKTVSINEFTQFSSLVKLTSKAKLDLKSLAASDSVAALGDIDDNGVLTAKKVVKLAPLQPNEKQLIYGSVAEITNQTISIKDKLGKIISVKLSASTDFNQGPEISTLNKIKVNQTVLAIVEKSSESTYSARLIYSYPVANIFKTKPASQSAVASPSAQAKKK